MIPPEHSMGADDVPSPCVSICALDAAGAHCLGCYRSLDEVASWPTLSPDERRRVLARVEDRRAARLDP
jgi:predicted Fe-S protein YdhL (DUF1289 family)